jgi:hypothetical protein
MEKPEKKKRPCGRRRRRRRMALKLILKKWDGKA